MTNIKDYVAVYFKKTKKIIEETNVGRNVVLQFFQRKDGIVACGIEEVKELLMEHTDTSKYSMYAVNDGDVLEANQPMIKLEGDYAEFVEFEGIIDGILARRSSVATNAKEVIKAANGKIVISMADRSDLYLNQPGDGHAMAVGGISVFVTDAQLTYIEGEPVGTIPHALIAIHGGDLIKALHAYKEVIKEKKLVALVDYNNDVITDTLKVANEFKDELAAVRVDTSQNLVDKSLEDKPENYGTCPNLIKLLRKELDDNGFNHVNIIVSSGFNPEKIRQFEAENTPVNIYGVGGYLTKIITNVSADIVVIDGKNESKHGRLNNTKYKLNKHF